MPVSNEGAAGRRRKAEAFFDVHGAEKVYVSEIGWLGGSEVGGEMGIEHKYICVRLHPQSQNIANELRITELPCPLATLLVTVS